MCSETDDTDEYAKHLLSGEHSKAPNCSISNFNPRNFIVLEKTGAAAPKAVAVPWKHFFLKI